MKRTWIVLFLLLTMVLLTGASVAAQSTATQTASAPDLTSVAAGLTRWFGFRVDRPTIGAGDRRGWYPSVVVAKGTTYVSYYDATNKDLRLAQYPVSSGNCGPNNTWYCQTIDSAGDVGQYSSLAVDTHATGLRLGIAYYDATNFALKYTNYACGLVCVTTTSTILKPWMAIAGQYASIKFDSSGGVHIAFQMYSLSSSVMYASTVSSGGNCGPSNTWRCDIIATGGAGTGRYISLALSPDNNPRIAYYDADNGDLRIAIFLFTGIGTGTCFNTDWWCGKIDDVGDMGRFASLQIDPSNNMHVAYYDATAGKLKYAHWVTSGANCGDQFIGNTVWRCDAIDTMGTGLSQAGISLAVDAKGYPNIVYQDASDTQGPAALMIARPAGAVGQFVGNCGPTIQQLGTWQCDTLDGGGSYVSEGDYASLAFSSTGLANVAYFETDDYYNTGYLKVLQQQLQLPLPLISK